MSPRRKWSYRPAVCVLEDRTVPSSFRTFPAGPATHLVVIAPAQVQADQSFTVEVEAEDASNRVATTFTGPVQLVLGTADAGATLPSYTFTMADGGVHLFQVTLTLAGSQTIGARDTANAMIAGGARTTVKPGAVTQFQVTASSLVPVGTATSITITAEDAANNTVTNFTGPVHLSAANSNLPATYTFVAGDHGKHTFNVTFTSAGSKTVSATSAVNSAITGQASLLAYMAGQATHFSVTVMGSVIAGVPTLVQITALNAGNQVAAGYMGFVHFTSSDSLASLPADYGFTLRQCRQLRVQRDIRNAGTQTLSATDTRTTSITGAATVVVSAAVSQGANLNPGYYGTAGYYANPGYYGSLGYYGSGYYGTPGYYGTGYYGTPAYYGTGYYGNLGYYTAPYYGNLGYYGALGNFGTGSLWSGWNGSGLPWNG